jgi:hypothetical protein
MGPRKAPIASIVADFAGLDAVSVDDHVCRVAVTQGATLASGFGTLFDASGAVYGARWGRFGGWLDQKGPPAVSRSLKIVCHTIAGCLADALKVLSPGLTPLMSVTGVAPASLQDATPDKPRNHGRIASGTEPNASTIEKVPVAADRSVVPALVTLPHAKRGLIPANVTRPVVVTCMTAVTADATTLAILESLVRLNILTQNPGLQHAASLAIGRPIGQARDNADNRGTVDRAEALPQDAAVVVGCHRVLSAKELPDSSPDPSSIAHRPDPGAELYTYI